MTTPRTPGDAPSLAVTLGLVTAGPAPVRLPPPGQQRVPGLSPLEASGWAVDAPAPATEERD